MKKFLKIFLLIFILATISCSKENLPSNDNLIKDELSQYQSEQWDGVKRGGVYYEIFVRSFADGDGDGIGDLKGITAKLDYLNELGISGIWLTPIFKASSYHGYDIEDYFDINSEYGTISDFNQLITKAHSLGIKVVLDFVLNHTSKYHPWFLSAKSSITSNYRNFFIFEKSDQISTRVSQGLVPMTQVYYADQWKSIDIGTTDYKYLGIFSDWMPDLNYGAVESCQTSPAFIEMCNAAKFWITKGVDGFRLDAVKHIYQNEDSYENPLFLSKFFNEIKKVKPDIYMIGEVFTTDYSKVAPYYSGLPAFFNFDAWNKLIYAINNSHAKWFPYDLINMGNAFKNVRADYIDALKLSNHDEDRALSVLDGNSAKGKIAAAILLTVGKSPYIYYGEEIGMLGYKGGDDRNVREPFLWTVSPGDSYTTKWYNGTNSTYSTITPLSVQKTDKYSLYNVYKKFIELRNSYPALAYGTLTLPTNFDSYSKNFMAFYREYNGQKLIIIHNVSSGTSIFTVNHTVDKAIADFNRVTYSKQKNSSVAVTMPPYSSIIFVI